MQDARDVFGFGLLDFVVDETAQAVVDEVGFETLLTGVVGGTLDGWIHSC